MNNVLGVREVRDEHGNDSWELVANPGHYGLERVLLADLSQYTAADIGAYIARVYERGRIDAKIEIRRALEV